MTGFPPFWYFFTDDTQVTRDIFTRVGKTLYIATRFESYCKSLRTLMDIKENVRSSELDLHDQESVEQFVADINKLSLHSHIQSITSKVQGGDDLSEILLKAKNSRNFVAHELTLGLEQNIDNDPSFWDTIGQSIQDAVDSILVGEYLILLLIADTTHEEPPFPKYIESNRKWTLA